METLIYVLKAPDCDKWVAIDEGSGGYPYLTHLSRCHKFYNKKAATEYSDIFSDKDYILQILHYHTTNV